MKEIIFHPHVIRKMRERDLSADDIIATVQNPQSVSMGDYGRKVAHRLHGKYWLKVIYEENEKHILVITAYPTKKR